MEKIRAKQVFTVETLDELRFLLTRVALNYIILCPNLEFCLVVTRNMIVSWYKLFNVIDNLTVVFL